MKINGKLPAGDADGVTSLEAVVLKNQKPIVVMMILEPTHVDQDLGSGQKTVRMGIRRIEPVLPDDIDAATRLIQRSYESRTGDSTLPIELENDINSALKGVDTYIPETAQEEEILVPEEGYTALTVPKLQSLLKRRGLDHSKGTKTDLVRRLQVADAAANDGAEEPTNVTSIFQAPSDSVRAEDVVDDEPDTSIPDADDDAWNAAAPEIPTPADGEYIADPDDENDE